MITGRHLISTYCQPKAGSPIRLTNGPAGESSFAWSPDGSQIAFQANRERGNQIWLISMKGGEAERLTDAEDGIREFCWSPDGKKIAYTALHIPDKAEREKRRKSRFDAIVVDDNLFYHHLWIIDIETRPLTRLTAGEFDVSGPQWSPDGRWIAYTASRIGWQESRYRDMGENRNFDIWITSIDGNISRRLTNNPGQDSHPLWSPNGTEIAYISNSDPSEWEAKRDLMVVRISGGAPRNLTEEFPESVSVGFGWAPDGKSLYFGAYIGVYTYVFNLPAAGGKVRQISAPGHVYKNFDISPDGKRIACIITDQVAPEEIYVVDLDSGKKVRISGLNRAARDISVAETEVIRWRGPDGLQIEGIVVKPLNHAPGERCPLIVQIHGGPYGRHSVAFDAVAQVFAANGYALFMPNVRGSLGYGRQFKAAATGDWGGRDFQDLISGVDRLISIGLADPDRLGIMGKSYGGFMVLWAITRTDIFKAAVALAPVSDWYSFYGQTDIPGLLEYGFSAYPWAARDTYLARSPLTHADKVKTPLLIAHGEQDRRVPISQSEQFYRALRKMGAEVVFVRYPREAHDIAEPNHKIDWLARQLDWFDSYLSKANRKAQKVGAAIRAEDAGGFVDVAVSGEGAIGLELFGTVTPIGFPAAVPP